MVTATSACGAAPLRGPVTAPWSLGNLEHGKHRARNGNTGIPGIYIYIYIHIHIYIYIYVYIYIYAKIVSLYSNYIPI